MANNILTNEVVASRFLMALQDELVMPALINTDYQNEFDGNINGFKKGQTIEVPLPATFVAEEWNGSTVTNQDFKEDSLSLKLDKIYDVTTSFSSIQQTTDIDMLSQRVIMPIACALAQKVNSAILADMGNGTRYTFGIAGTTPGAITDYTGIDKVLNDNKAPLANRRMVMDTSMREKMLQLAIFTEADKVGDEGSALREASLGKKYGFQNFMSQGVYTHTKGTLSSTASVLLSAAVQARRNVDIT